MIRRLGITVGTRLEMITDHYGVWRIWTAIKNKQVPPEKYQGTFLELCMNGNVFQYNTETEEVFEVMDRRDKNDNINQKRTQRS